MKPRIVTLGAAGLLILTLVIPMLIPDPPRTVLQGPELEDMEYTEAAFHNDEGLRLAGMMFLPLGDKRRAEAALTP